MIKPRRLKLAFQFLFGMCLSQSFKSSDLNKGQATCGSILLILSAMFACLMSKFKCVWNCDINNFLLPSRLECVCVCVCMYNLHTFMCVCEGVCLHVCVCTLHLYACVCEGVCLHVCVLHCTCMHVCVCVCVCVCVLVCAYALFTRVKYKPLIMYKRACVCVSG